MWIAFSVMHGAHKLKAMHTGVSGSGLWDWHTTTEQATGKSVSECMQPSEVLGVLVVGGWGRGRGQQAPPSPCPYARYRPVHGHIWILRMVHKAFIINCKHCSTHSKYRSTCCFRTTWYENSCCNICMKRGPNTQTGITKWHCNVLSSSLAVGSTQFSDALWQQFDSRYQTQWCITGQLYIYIQKRYVQKKISEQT